MLKLFPSRVSVGAIFAAVLVAGFSFNNVGQSQEPQKGQKSKAKAKVDPQVKLKESEVLKEAYIFIAMANHDYDGHREKAMHQVADGIKILDISILKEGNNGQKVVALEEEIAAARAKFLAKHQGKVHESQALSDLQMREAHQLLVNVEKALAQHNQPKVREHVGNAVTQVAIALKIR